ncbi:v-type ATPase 116kDa subunit family protein [Bacteroides sp. CAG:530]|nr:v-type ATPase 116kDa subunit family protein [Bacteroides sp. CAG:530]
MISKMKKLAFLIYHKDYDTFLEQVRNLGVVHVVTKSQGEAENQDLQATIRLSARYAAAIKLLEGMNVKAADKTSGNADKGEQVLDKLETLQQHDAETNHRIQAIEKEITAMEPWGDFKMESLKRLRDAGYEVGFYICSDKVYDEEWETLYHAVVINHIGSKVYFVTVTPVTETVSLDVESAKIADRSLSEIIQEKEKLDAERAETENAMKELAENSIPDLKAAQVRTSQLVDFDKVKLSADSLAGNKLMLLEGWAPAENAQQLNDFLKSSEVYYEISDPVPGDNVPIQLNNKGFFKLFEPIMKLYMLPKYNELDLTPFFAPFFMLFFGLCLGDTGYGLFILLGISGYRLIAKSISPSMKPILTLVQLLGLSTAICGLLTGTCFGFNLYDINVPFIQKMKEVIMLDNQQMFNLSLILGAIQIIFGMTLKAVNQAIQFGFKYAISTIGWLLVLVSTAVAFAAPSVMAMGGTLHLAILAVGGLMVYLFNSPGKNIFLNIGLGLWDTYNMATGLLGDILSYVRLFALGLSGGILAGVFNSLAVGMSPDNVIAGPIVMVLIFVIGHSINIFMNVLGAMVHPMRLTFVEFFKNSGYEGGGKEYKPFKN